MSTTNFVDNNTVIYASWLNDVDAHVYDQVAGAHVASNITNTPAGNISSTTVQAAINELDSEKIATSAIGVSVQAYDVNTTKNNVSNTFTVGQTFTGAITANGGITNSDAETLNISSATSQDITLSPGGTERIRVTSDGRLYGGALHNNAGAVTGTTNQYVASGTYTPTLTNVNNAPTTTARLSTWMRVGNAVTVSGYIDLSGHIVALVQIGVSLPIASAFVTGYEGCGYAGAMTAAAASHVGGQIGSDPANDRMQINIIPSVTTAQIIRYQFTYEVK